MSFLDPTKPLATCTAQSCAGCPVSRTLRCHFGATDLARFLAAALPSFILGGIGIGRVNIPALVSWVVIIGVFFELVEIRVLCAHCPHYAEATGTLRCWANYGAPKLWRYRPGPLSSLEKAILGGGFLVIWGYPLAFLLVGKQWFLLVAYTLTSMGFFFFLKQALCSRCMNFACPLNSAGETARSAFFTLNPQAAKAWERIPKPTKPTQR
jgi:hypothetical protein